MDPVLQQKDTGLTSGRQGKPDIMNDAAYETNVKDQLNNQEDPDTCRICRGEPTADEPLFYPCKCSGSIKFVHQHCLVEWLSHSQKKHCELCKTPFHFTKLYDQNMPNTVPLPVFLRQAAVHTWRSLLTSSRFLLVIFVWMAWLPWCMRTIWRGLFWIGDGAWADWTERRLHMGSMSTNMSTALTATGTSPAQQGLLISREVAASTFINQISNKLPRIVPSFRQISSFPMRQPFGLTVLKRLYYSTLGRGSNPSPSSASNIANVTGDVGANSRSTWLSEVQIFKTLTRSTTFNNIVIDIFEGQLITLFVVFAFILIFLIREWVVQHQPMINGGIDLDAEVAIVNNPEALVQQRNGDEGAQAAQVEGAVEPANRGQNALGNRARIIARARPRRPRGHRRASDQEGNRNGDAAAMQASEGGIRDPASQPISSQDDPSMHPGLHNTHQRPHMPDRDISARAADLRRTLEEQHRASDAEHFGMNVTEDLLDRASNQPLEVIRLIEEQGRSEELGWIIEAMRKIQEHREASKPIREDISSDSPETQNPDMGYVQSEDEEYILLNKPSLTPSPEPQHDKEADTDRQPSARLDVDVTMTGDLAQAQRSASEGVEYPSSSQNAQNIPDLIDGASATKTTVAEQEAVEPDNDVANERKFEPTASSTTSSNDNPFHPDYEGNLDDVSHSPYPSTLDRTSAGPSDTEQLPSTADQPNENPTQVPPANEPPNRRRPLTEVIAEWLWGGITPLPAIVEQPAGDDERIVDNIADEAPFVPVDHGQPMRLAANDRAVANQDPEVVAAAIQAGIDPNEAEVAEEIEDLEGILELIGMQGPLAGLVQNGMFCACLVSLTIGLGVWVPYISGKVFLVLLTHPITILFRIPLRWATSTADFVIDLFTFLFGCSFYWTDTSIRMLCYPIKMLLPTLDRLGQNRLLAETARDYAESALERLSKSFMATGNVLSVMDVPTFSVIAHESLRSIESRLALTVHVICDCIATVFNAAYNSGGLIPFLKVSATTIADYTNAMYSLAAKSIPNTTSFAYSLRFNPLQIKINLPRRSTPFDYGLAHWDMNDRALAVFFGYLFFGVLGVLYLRVSSWTKKTNRAGRVAGGVADALYQAGGVMKVVLIIGIEMIIFPLYCGILLDVALLPLFGNATIISRVSFSLTSPSTSIFIHWFVGTCYMFHFALFVSMCRRILRSGVLYFIRDPDDPNFHPVRDVLERSVSTQLWKISFSALVYGGLVIVCLGGVVWGIACSFDSVLPIRWSSDEPVLEFPVDLLFYNFLMPFAVRFFKPDKGLNKVFSWWFRKCARALRLTNFLFGEEKEDEKGSLTWADLGRRIQTQFKAIMIREGQHDHAENSEDYKSNSKVMRDGRYVRVPGSDQVRIPKGVRTFLEVDENNYRLDGQPDLDEGLHGRKNEMFTKVYVPPWFRLRISAFVLLLWSFAAATGISLTLVPLVFGRTVYAMIMPNQLYMNDIYAFSIGVYILGGILYGVTYRERIAGYVHDKLTPHTTTITFILHKSASMAVHLLSLIYTYAAFGILLPALLALLMEFYLIIPLHTYLSTTYKAFEIIHSEHHVIHVIQDWTLGVLYLKMVVRLILNWNPTSRPASALRGIVRDGWLTPDVRLATRGFIVPAVLTMLFALVAPLGLGWIANTAIQSTHGATSEAFKASVYRYSYPGVLAIIFTISLAMTLQQAFMGWRKRVRDEVYLIGERLHNFGESKRRKGNGKGKERAVDGQT